MTNEQTKEQFLIALNTNAYLGMCEAADMVNAIKALEKQIPRKPNVGKKAIPQVGVDHFPICSVCGCEINNDLISKHYCTN